MQIINNEYMSQSKKIRQGHLDLEDECIERILKTQYQQQLTVIILLLSE